MKNDVNRNALTKFQACVNFINDVYRGRRVGKDVAPLDKTHGIVGWDVPCEEPEWLTKITGSKWDPKMNPRVTPTGQWYFSKCAIAQNVIEKVIGYLHKQTKDGRKTWSSLFPYYIDFRGDGSTWSTAQQHLLHRFLMDDSQQVLMVAWGRHARTFFKDPVKNLITVIDPWIKNVDRTATFKKIAATIWALSENRFRMNFLNRVADQGAEGSCVALALIRAILMAEYGISGATRAIHCTDAILTSRLISKFRRAQR